MTATAVASPPCPKCGAAMYDNRLTKKNPKQPDFKCTQYKTGCEGVIWPPKGAAPPTPKAKAPPASFASKPEGELPEFLRNQADDDAADLARKVHGDSSDPRTAKKEAFATAQYESVKIALDILVPLFEAKEIGLTDDVVHKLSYELFRTWCDKGLVG